MKIRRSGESDDKIQLQMTPMIDIVFQLLVFFIMTFKIVVQEGDFNIKMPLEQAAGAAESLDPPPNPIAIRLTANNDGTLSNIQMKIGPAGYESLGTDFQELRDRIIDYVGDERSAESESDKTEVELECDYDLHYLEVVEAITHVSGFLDDDGHLVTLIQNIKFKPQPTNEE